MGNEFLRKYRRFGSLLLIAAFCWSAVNGQAERDRVVLPVPASAPATAPDGAPSPARRGGAPATLDEFRARVSGISHRPGLSRAQIGIKIASLDTGRVIYEENADKLYMPASNMKIYTMAAALDRLGPEFRFTTSVYTPTKPDASGAVRGDLIVYGRGDPSISTNFTGGDYWKGINDLAQKIADTGLKRVEGDLVGDESYFRGPALGAGWEWDDLQSYDGAPISALTINNNAVDLFVKPGASVGAACSVTTGPPVPVVTIANRTITGAPGSKRDISVSRYLGETVIEVTGSLPLGDQGITSIVSLPDPALAFVYLLRSALSVRGVILTGRTRTISSKNRPNPTPYTQNYVELTRLASPPLGEIAGKTLKPSQNLYTELVLRALGEEAGPKLATLRINSSDLGHEVVKQFLATAGLDPASYALADGSGLSRHNLISASGTVQLLTYMSRHRYAAVFRDALPVAGMDGTLKNRLREGAATGNLQAKTGTINQVAALSGYVTTAAGERLVFSIIVNNLPEDSNVRRSYIDDIASLMAALTAKS
jgi:D-alanyl-D-alanine carboxypeptidase/D-alanyl-D-alanine-endopeptidase (penicillin-binding protein 4)